MNEPARPFFPLLYLLICLMLAGNAFGQANQAAEDDSQDIADQSHAGVHAGLFELADQVDQFFGDVRSLEQRQSDWFRAGIIARTQSGDGSTLSQKFGASINLEHISERLKFIIAGSGGDDPVPTNRTNQSGSGEDFAQGTRSNSVASGLRFDLLSESDLLVRFDGGIRIKSGMNLYPFVRSRASRWFDLGWWEVAAEPQFALIMEREDGFGQELRLDFNKQIAQSLLRFRSQATHFEDRSAIEVLEELSIYHQLRRRSFIGAAISFLSPFENYPIRYRTSVRYRRQFWKPWLFAEVEPGVDFLEDRNYDAAPYILLRLDVYFDRERASEIGS